MNAAQLNYLNVGLMLISCALAFVLPFELFLFSYAILGPLHYLTEINWLHKRQYFTTAKKDYLVLVVLCLLVVSSVYFKVALSLLLPTDSQGNVLVSAEIMDFANTLDGLWPTFLLAAFGAALIMILVESRKLKWISYGLLLVLCFLFREDKTYLLPFAVFLPSVGHVFLFTGAFILVGALKSRSSSAFFSLIVFSCCALSFFLFVPEAGGYTVSEKLRYNYNVSFLTLNLNIFDIFLPAETAQVQTTGQLLALIYESKLGIIITRFLAFAYTYHYLNWFSKTSVIKWHQVPRLQLAAVGVFWCISMGLFFYDYKAGFLVLYLLSMLHVLLEFPLNFHSFKQIGEQVKLLILPKRMKAEEAATA